MVGHVDGAIGRRSLRLEKPMPFAFYELGAEQRSGWKVILAHCPRCVDYYDMCCALSDGGRGTDAVQVHMTTKVYMHAFNSNGLSRITFNDAFWKETGVAGK